MKTYCKPETGECQCRKLRDDPNLCYTGAPTENLMVTEKAQRPARMDGTCFYCNTPIGGVHKHDCVLVSRKARVRLTIEYEIDVPAFWNKQNVEFYRNEGSWCADNLIDELKVVAEQEGCLCGIAEFEWLGDASEPFLSE